MRVIRPRNVRSYTPLGCGPNGPGPPCAMTHPRGIMGDLCLHKSAPGVEPCGIGAGLGGLPRTLLRWTLAICERKGRVRSSPVRSKRGDL
jgi:hypothetical protein